MTSEVKTHFRGPGEWRSQVRRLEESGQEELTIESRIQELARSVKQQTRRRRSSRSIGRRDPSLRWPHLYDVLRGKGYSKEKSARISNSRVGFRKKGRLVVKKGPKF